MNLNSRIVVAFIFGLIMVGGAFLLSNAENAENTDNQLKAQTTGANDSFRNFIAVKDSDRNGLPDWQESLNTNTIDLDEAPPETLTQTASLAVELATRTNSQNSNANEILSDIGTKLARESYDTQYNEKDVVPSSDNSPYSLRVYGNKIAAIIFDNAPPKGTEDELTVLNRALLKNKEEDLDALSPTIASYENMVQAMLALTVPSSMLREHLALVNVYQALQSDIKAFQNVFTDALPTMIRFRRYQADTEALYLAITMLYEKLDQSGIQWNNSDIASKLIKVE